MLLCNVLKCWFFFDVSILEIIEWILWEYDFNKIFVDFEFMLNWVYCKCCFVM